MSDWSICGPHREPHPCWRCKREIEQAGEAAWDHCDNACRLQGFTKPCPQCVHAELDARQEATP